MIDANPTSAIDKQPAHAADDLAQAADTIAERRRLVEAIRAFNPSATPAFLDAFSTASLQDYLDHLSNAKQKNVRLRGWLQVRSAALEESRRQLQQRRAA